MGKIDESTWKEDGGVTKTNIEVAGRQVVIESTGDALFIGLQGHEVANMADGPIVRIDWYYGEPTLYVWADVNQEDPTHIIKLGGASKELYVERGQE